MKQKTFFCLMYCLLVLKCITIRAQSSDIEALKSNFTDYSERTLTEKIFLHTDRNFYISGEILWFKAYLVNNVDNRLSSSGKVIYIEMLDDLNKPVLQAKVAVDQGTGMGSFFLSSDFPSGVYKLRAYTAWMKNFDADYFFEKQITIVNATVPLAQLPADTSEVYDIRFFPEGGNLVSDISSTVGFRMTDKSGNGVQVFNGVVVDENNDTVAAFQPYKFGTGRFRLAPATNKKYTAYIKTATGRSFSQSLPPVLSSGYTMEVKRQEKDLHIRVYSHGVEGSSAYLLVHTRGIVKKAVRLTLQHGEAAFTVPFVDMGDGISHITLFDGNRRPVCERLYYGGSPQPLGVQAVTDAAAYRQRRKITLTVNTADMANLSLAVFRNDSLQKTEPFDIRSYLWLSSELKGKIESPGWYFSDQPDSTAEAIDNLLLTQGWRRFNWHDVLQKKLPAFTYLPEIDGHIINGKITDSLTRKGRRGSLVFLSFPGTHNKFYTSESDRDGHLVFYTKDVYGQSELIAEADDLLNSPAGIEIFDPFSEEYSLNKLPSLQLRKEYAEALRTNSINAQVVRKFGEDRLKELRYPPLVDTTKFYGKADETYLLDNYTRFTTMEEVLREYVLGILVGKSGKNYRLTVIDALSNSLLKDNPLVLLDGVPVLDMNRIIEYDPLKVRKLDIVKGKYYYGPSLFYGIADFTTYKGNMENYEMSRNAVVLDYDGLQMQREFYSPVYETPEQQQHSLADYRNLLFWNPEIRTGKDGKAEISFYSSDLSGSYNGIIQGISADGKSGSTHFSFTVQ